MCLASPQASPLSHILLIVFPSALVVISFCAWIIYRYRKSERAHKYRQLPVTDDTSIELRPITEVTHERIQRPDSVLQYDFGPLLAFIETENFEIGSDAVAETRFETPPELERCHVHLSSKLLGKGHYGIVYSGIYNPDNRLVPPCEIAAKSFTNDVSNPVQAREHLFREAAITYQFQHRNVVACIGVVSIGEPCLIIMQYCKKGSLKNVLVNERRPSSELGPSDKHRFLEYALDIAHGMEHIHAKYFVHRDLAVRNILVNSLDSCMISVRVIPKMNMNSNSAFNYPKLAHLFFTANFLSIRGYHTAFYLHLIDVIYIS